MIEIILEGKSLDLKPNTTIEFNLKNPLFSEDGTVPGSYTIPFTLPLSDKNKNILGFPNILESENKWSSAGVADVLLMCCFFRSARGLYSNPGYKS